jgi:hypothetical protein
VTACTELRPAGAGDGPARGGRKGTRKERTELRLAGAGDGPAREGRTGTHEAGIA